jgi:hypothetical protein
MKGIIGESSKSVSNSDEFAISRKRNLSKTPISKRKHTLSNTCIIDNCKSFNRKTYGLCWAHGGGETSRCSVIGCYSDGRHKKLEIQYCKRHFNNSTAPVIIPMFQNCYSLVKTKLGMMSKCMVFCHGSACELHTGTKSDPVEVDSHYYEDNLLSVKSLIYSFNDIKLEPN